MQFTAGQLIAAARALVDDDHDSDSWIAQDVWLQFLNWEYQSLYRKMVHKSLVSPATIDVTFTGYTSVINGVLAVCGAAENMGDHYRMLHTAQGGAGRSPYWVASGSPQGPSTTWSASGSGDNFTVELNPRDPTGSYTVRYVPAPTYLAALTDTTVDLPVGTERLIVLGMVSYAMAKESSASAAIERKIAKAEEEFGMGAFGRLDGDSPRVRRVRPQFHRNRWANMLSNQFPTDPNYWIFP